MVCESVKGFPPGAHCSLGMSFWLSTLGARRLEDRCVCSLRELSATANEGTKPSGTALDKKVEEPCSLLPLNHRRMDTRSLRADVQARTVGLDAVRWAPVAMVTQVHLLRIDANGVWCGFLGALGYGCYRWEIPRVSLYC